MRPAEGCDLAVIVTQPGSKSHQDAQRQGFHLLYTRAVSEASALQCNATAPHGTYLSEDRRRGRDLEVPYRRRMPGPVAVPEPVADEAELVDRLRRGDEAAFAEVVERYHPQMVRLALTRVRTRAVAEEVAQDAWLGLLRGIGDFEGRSSLRSWLFRIVVNRAITAGVREHAHVPVGHDEVELRGGTFKRDGSWVEPPVHWADEVLERLSAPALAARAHEAIADLPPGQRSVVTMRDVDGLTSAEVCSVLDITEGNQRVLLHRGRARVRAALEQEVLP
jgi:RNA polymerase sigma-70 factor (ECF subfamily)